MGHHSTQNNQLVPAHISRSVIATTANETDVALAEEPQGARWIPDEPPNPKGPNMVSKGDVEV
jgi:hypothetical protein